MALTKGNNIHLPVSLKVTNYHFIPLLFNPSKKQSVKICNILPCICTWQFGEWSDYFNNIAALTVACICFWLSKTNTPKSVLNLILLQLNLCAASQPCTLLRDGFISLQQTMLGKILKEWHIEINSLCRLYGFFCCCFLQSGFAFHTYNSSPSTLTCKSFCSLFQLATQEWIFCTKSKPWEAKPPTFPFYYFSISFRPCCYRVS